MKKSIEDLNMKMRSIVDQVEKGEVTADAGEQEIKNLRAEKVEMEKRSIVADVPMNTRTDSGAEEIRSALMEKRAIVLGANGDSSFSEKVFEVSANKSEILSKITIETGAKPNTKFQLFSPSLNNITRVSEDGTGSTVSTAAFAPVTVIPAPYLGYVNVSDYFLKNNPLNLDAKLKEMFGKAYVNVMAKEVINGNGSTAMQGVFGDALITTKHECAAAGAPKLADLLKLVGKLVGKFNRSELSIVINPSLWIDIMAEDTKFSYINNGGDFYTFNGVRVIESDDAPDATTTKSVVAVIGNFEDYGVGVAYEAEVKALGQTAGSLNIPVQGTMYFDGKAIVPSSFAKLTAK